MSGPWPGRNSSLHHTGEEAALAYINCCAASARRLMPLGYDCSVDQVRDKSRLRECRDMNRGGPISGIEGAGFAVALRDDLDRMSAHPFIVAGDPHGHMASDIDRDSRDIAARIREQAAKFEHGRSQLIVLKEWNAVLSDQNTAGFHAAAATGVELGAEQNLSRADRIG